MPVEGGPWHARCPICEQVHIAPEARDAMDLATEHCSKKAMRAELDALKAWIQMRDATFSPALKPKETP
jgi:hypothetical protein